MPGDSGGILLVCAANVCRSPMAEFTMRRHFSRIEGLRWLTVRSAGIRAATRMSVCGDVARFIVDDAWAHLADAHRPRSLEVEDLRRSGLILTASRGIRASVVAAAPERRHTVFTLREAVWLGEGYGADLHRDAEAAVSSFQQHLDSMRGLRQVPRAPRRLLWRRESRDPFDIQDGHNLRDPAHQETLRTVEEAASEIAELILGRGLISH